MKKIYYCVNCQLTTDIFLYYNAFNDCFLFLNNKKSLIYEKKSPEEIRKIDSTFFDLLVNNSFIVEDELDELSITEFRKMHQKMNAYQYNIVVNTTLDCNLNCWYCYESKIEGSALNDSVLDIIKKNIVQKYDISPYKELKVSFFGGEPLRNFKAVEYLLLFCKSFSEQNNLSLIVDFTTNATLINSKMLSFLKDYKCFFQITLDGDRERHNQIRFLKKNKKGTYDLVLRNIYRIQQTIPNAKTWIRLNFDDKTLANFPLILEELLSLDRKRNYIILRKVWQFPIENIDKSLILDTLQIATENDFVTDYYTLPRHDVCFADRYNQVLFNYDGKVFKCSTLECFDDENTEGIVNEETGKISWNLNKISSKFTGRSPERCRNCKLYPACLGPCGKHTNNGDDFCCIVDATGLSIEEFVLFAFKQEQLRKKIFEEELL